MWEYECVALGIAARYARVASYELSNYFLKSRICIFGYYYISFDIIFDEYLQNRKMYNSICKRLILEA